eukprot:s49_g51.t1
MRLENVFQCFPRRRVLRRHPERLQLLEVRGFSLASKLRGSAQMFEAERPGNILVEKVTFLRFRCLCRTPTNNDPLGRSSPRCCQVYRSHR